MAKGFKMGGGAAVNYRVIGAAEKPDGYRENLIWIQTETPVTDHIFSPVQPVTGDEGMVWIRTGLSSPAAFNALRRHTLTVCPAGAYQYISGAWVAKNASMFDGEVWIDWLTYLYRNGDICEGTSGGWEEVTYRSTTTSTSGSTEMAETVMNVTAKANPSGSAVRFGLVAIHAQDLTQVHTIRARGECTSAKNGASGKAGIGIRVVSSKSLKDEAAKEAVVTEKGAADITVDVSDLTGSYYIICYAFETMASGYSNGTTGSGSFAEIWME